MTVMELIINQQFKSLLPRLTPEEKSILESSIRIDGCREPLVVWKGQIIDGHNRYEICTRLGIPFEIIEIEFENEEAAMDWIDCNQLGRRNLTPDAFRLALGRHYNRVKKAVGQHKGNQYTGLELGQIDPIPSTAAQLAAEYGVSEATVKRAGQFAKEVENKPELQEAINNNVPVNKFLREERHNNKIETPFPNGKYQVIYADPPWRYDNTGFYNSSDANYPTMTVEEICNLPVASISTDASVLFLWATNPLLIEAIQVMAAWGFEYKTNIAWMKDRGRGFGWFLKSKHELLLIGVKPMTDKPVERPDSAFQFDRPPLHSKKPEQFYSIIESMYLGKKIEMFGREKRDGWDLWGNENV